MAETTDPPVIRTFAVARKNKLFAGYAAFNNGDRAGLAELLCEDVVWHPMDGSAAITGKDEVLDYLLNLRGQGTEAELLGVASQENTSITVDYTYNGPEGDHACADKIVFDDSGCIKEVWHCAAATHQHGHAGHPAGKDHIHT